LPLEEFSWKAIERALDTFGTKDVSDVEQGPYLSARCKTIYFLGTNIFRTSDFLKNRYLGQTKNRQNRPTYKSQFNSFSYFRYQ